MTARIRTVTVILEQDMREDDAQGILDAILQLRGVAAVEPKSLDITDHIALSVAKSELRVKIYSVLHEALQ